MFSGGALERMSILALGVVPYITSSIIMNLMSMMYPSLQQLRKEGESGRRKITQYTRYGTLLIALIQGTSLSVTLANQGLAFTPGLTFLFVATTTLVTGALFMMWLGEQITERGVGNGISLIIYSGIVSGLSLCDWPVLRGRKAGRYQYHCLAGHCPAGDRHHRLRGIR